MHSISLCDAIETMDVGNVLVCENTFLIVNKIKLKMNDKSTNDVCT